MSQGWRDWLLYDVSSLEWGNFFIYLCFLFLFFSILKWNNARIYIESKTTAVLCRLRSIAVHRDNFVWRLSVRSSVRSVVTLSWNRHTMLTHSYVSQATHAILGMPPLFCNGKETKLFYFSKTTDTPHKGKLRHTAWLSAFYSMYNALSRWKLPCTLWPALYKMVKEHFVFGNIFEER